MIYRGEWEKGGEDSMSDVPALSIRGLSKTFPGTKALDKVDFDLVTGEIHALVGQNGSGKSTLIKILCGYHESDPGAEATVDGTPFKLGDSVAAFRAGLRFVHQDLGLAPTLGALDNLAMGRGYLRGRTGTISWRKEAKTARELLGSLGYDFDLEVPVTSLAAAERTGIAIARALQGWEEQARILVLDEPTASLPAAEVDRMFKVLRMVNDRGVALIYVSHHFGEVFEISDRITVLRDGAVVATETTNNIDESHLIELTIGRVLSGVDTAKAAHPKADGPEPGAVLSVRSLHGEVVRGLELGVTPGEIVGFAGVTGSGREEICELIVGSSPRFGQVLVDGAEVPPGRPDLSFDAGMAFVPADRLANATFLDMGLRENTTISSLSAFLRPFGIDKRAETAEAEVWLRKLEVVPPKPDLAISTLSGGNQQKVVMARALRLAPRVLVLDSPTQGVDVGSKASIHSFVREAASQGAAVVIASTESEELSELCDRVLVLADGLVRTTCHRGTSADQLTELTLRGQDYWAEATTASTT
jgi:ribose transport system ATP-binding protein